MPTDHIDTDVFGDNNRRVVSSDDSAAEEAAGVQIGNNNAQTRDIKPDGQVHKEADGMFAAAVRCPTAVVGLVAGRDQHNFKDIATRHPGVKIEIARRRPEDSKAYASKPFMEWVENTRCCVVNVWSGKKDITEAALEEVEIRVQTAAKRAPFTHFVCLPFLAEENQPLITAIEAFKSKTLSKSNLPNDGIDESVMVTSKQIHFTLLLLRIYDEATMKTVLSTLDEFCAALKAKKSGPSFPLKVHFKGIHVFETDKPTRANVVFTHAGQPAQITVETSPVAATSPVAGGATDTAQSDSDELPPGHVMTKTIQNIEQTQTRLQRLCEVKNLEDEHRKVITACLSTIPPVLTSLKALAERAPGGRARAPGGRASLSTPARTRDVSTVTGPVVSDIFNMFEVLVNKMSQAGVLTDEDKRERHIQANADGKLSPQSLTLHLTLMSSKWRSPASARKLADKQAGKRVKPTRLRGINARPKPVYMDVSNVLDANHDFGEAVITTLQLCRRAMSAGGDFSYPEKVYKLSD